MNEGRPQHPDRRTAARRRLETAEEWRREFNERIDDRHWNSRLIGLAALRFLENGILALFDANNDDCPVDRPINGYWNLYAASHGKKDSETATWLNEAMNRLLDHTSVPGSEAVERRWNLLGISIGENPLDIPTDKLKTQEGRLELQTLLNEAAKALAERIRELAGISREDLFPGGTPWKQQERHWSPYEGPGWTRIRLEPGEVKRISGYSEVLIAKEIGGTEYTALVPSHTLGPNDRWVPAWRAADRGGKAVFHLPVGNDGRPDWRVPHEDVDRMLDF